MSMSLTEQKIDLYLNNPDILFDHCDFMIQYFRGLEKYLIVKNDPRLTRLASDSQLGNQVTTLESKLGKIMTGDRIDIMGAFVFYSFLKVKYDIMSKEFSDFEFEHKPRDKDNK